jgi:hypothetical protein
MERTYEFYDLRLEPERVVVNIVGRLDKQRWRGPSVTDDNALFYEMPASSANVVLDRPMEG